MRRALPTFEDHEQAVRLVDESYRLRAAMPSVRERDQLIELATSWIWKEGLQHAAMKVEEHLGPVRRPARKPLQLVRRLRVIKGGK